MEAILGMSRSSEATDEKNLTLFQSALADRWQQLPKALQTLDSSQDKATFSGVAQISRGGSVLSELIAWAVGFPPAGKAVPVMVTKACREAGEVWERNFQGRVFHSTCLPSPQRYHVRERLGVFTFELALNVTDDGISLPIRRGWCLGLPIPSTLLSKSESREFVHENKFHFDIVVLAPFGLGLIVRYQGWLLPVSQGIAE